jgi:hypothetical protein
MIGFRRNGRTIDQPRRSHESERQRWGIPDACFVIYLLMVLMLDAEMTASGRRKNLARRSSR